MFDSLRKLVLRITRVPGEPHPPLGAAGSVRVFRAGKNYYHLRLFAWGFTQVGAIIGIMFSLWFLGVLDRGVADIRTEAAKARAAEAAKAAAQPATVRPAPAASPAPNVQPPPSNPTPPPKARRNWKQSDGLARGLSHWPGWFIPLLHWIEYGAILLFLCQVPVTYAATRLEFEQHWYIVTDRSLRIRSGLFSLQESTMSFANLQQVEVKQGPLQRLLKMADVHVQSAGGGGERPGHVGDSLHTGIFHSVENANDIRDLILERLRCFRQAGLGDPDDRGHSHEAASVSTPANGDALAAAREVLAETRALRAALG